jgi:hypothetical protein
MQYSLMELIVSIGVASMNWYIDLIMVLYIICLRCDPDWIAFLWSAYMFVRGREFEDGNGLIGFEVCTSVVTYY